MRISDWSSDVCSSDLNAVLDHEHGATDIQRKGTVPYSTVHILNRGISRHLRNTGIRRVVMENVDPAEALAGDRTKVADTLFLGQIYRSEKRRVGKECVSPLSSRMAPLPEKKNKNKYKIE